MQIRPNKLWHQSRSMALLEKGKQMILDSVVCLKLVRNVQTGFRKYARFFKDIHHGVTTFLHIGWQKSGIRGTIFKTIHLFRGIRKKIALKLNVSPIALSITRFVLLAQIIVLPLFSVFGLSIAGPVWGGIFFALFLLFLLQKNICYPETNSGLFVFWSLVSLSAMLVTSFGFRTHYYGLLSLFLMVGWLTGRVLTKADVRAVMKYTVGASVIWIVLGLTQKISGIATPPGWIDPEQTMFIVIRIYAIFKNPNVFALYLVIILIWAYYLRLDVLACDNYSDRSLRQPARRGSVILYQGIILIDLVALYFTYSRIAWLIAGMLFFYWNRDWMNYKKWLIIGGLGTVCFFLLSDFQSRMAGLFLTDSSVWQRLSIWRSVGKAILEYGWWGAGPGNFNAAYAWFGSSVAPWAQHAHNQYLQIWLENGFFSLIAFFAMIKKGVKRFFGEDLMVKAMGLSMAAFLVYGLTDTWTASPFLGGLFWLMMGFGEASLLDVVHGDLRKPK